MYGYCKESHVGNSWEKLLVQTGKTENTGCMLDSRKQHTKGMSHVSCPVAKHKLYFSVYAKYNLRFDGQHLAVVTSCSGSLTGCFCGLQTYAKNDTKHHQITRWIMYFKHRHCKIQLCCCISCTYHYQIHIRTR